MSSNYLYKVKADIDGDFFLPFVLACCKLESATKRERERERKKGDDLYCLADLLKQPIKP